MAAVLRLEGVSFYRGERRILAPFSWGVEAQSTAAILGPNGCGKSTLLRLISGYLWPTKGTVELLGKTLGTYPVAKLRGELGIVEAVSVYPFDDEMTARDVVCSGHFSALTLHYVEPTAAQWAATDHALAQVGLAPFAGQAYVTMSTGQRLRALIARALVARPKLLLLDEPTNGLDLPSREAVLATLHQIARQPDRPAMITITHHLEELLPETENVILLDGRGAVVKIGPAREVLTDANLSAAYDCPVQVSQRDGRYTAHVSPHAWSELLRRV
jgi:iron complex transport system ATP-binding protein